MMIDSLYWNDVDAAYFTEMEAEQREEEKRAECDALLLEVAAILNEYHLTEDERDDLFSRCADALDIPNRPI